MGEVTILREKERGRTKQKQEKARERERREKGTRGEMKSNRRRAKGWKGCGEDGGVEGLLILFEPEERGEAGDVAGFGEELVLEEKKGRGGRNQREFEQEACSRWS